MGIVRLILILHFFMLGITYAHTLKIDGTIGIVVHVDPNDEPISGQPSSISIQIKDTTGRFSPSLCNCTLNILKNNKQVATLPITSTTSSPQLTYTFPNSGVYSLQIIGEPLQEGEFQPFSLSYEYYVASALNFIVTNSSVTEYQNGPNALQTYFPYVAIAATLTIVLMFLLPLKVTENGEKND